MGRVAPLPSRIACCVAALTALAAAQQPAAPETYVLEGRVVDLRGEGVPAAKVWTATWQEPGKELTKAVADGEGYFRVKVTRTPGLQVHATGEGTCRGVASVGRTTRSVRVDVHDAATVRGVLRSRDGRPLKDTIVRAALQSRVLSSVQSDARTDGDGRFELAGVPLGPVRIAAWAEGEGLAEVDQLITADCEVTLAPIAVATTDLRVELAGLPPPALEGARVSLLPYHQGRLRRLPPPFDLARLDASGVLAIEQLPDIQYRVRVTADGFVIGPQEVVAEPTKGPHVLKFTATPSKNSVLEWKATVRGPDDQPVADLAFVMRASNGGHEATATSDAEGKLTFQCPLAAGSNVIVYSTDDRWVIDQEKVQEGMFGAWDRRFLDDHECKVDTSATLQLRVVPACSVKGRLLKDGDRPAAFVQVQLEERRPNRTPEWATMASATTDRDGQFVFARQHHLDDPVRVMVNTRDGAVTSEPLAMAAAGSRLTVPDLRLQPPASISGVVLDAQQRPAPGIRVWLRDWDLAKGNQRSGSVTEVITDRQGRYRFLGVPPGGAYLNVLTEPGEQRAFDRTVEPFEVEPGAALTFDLQLPAK